jgi:hypothetical protein
MTFCSLWVSFYRLFEQNLQYENLIIQTRRFSRTTFLHSWRTKHLNSNHQLFPTASFSPQPAFQKSWSEKSRTKHAILTFHLLLFFHLLTITRSPTTTGINSARGNEHRHAMNRRREKGADLMVRVARAPVAAMQGEEQARLRVASAAGSLNWHGRDLILVVPTFVHLGVKGEENFGKKKNR